jgi:hypothetical protein
MDDVEESIDMSGSESKKFVFYGKEKSTEDDDNEL